MITKFPLTLFHALVAAALVTAMAACSSDDSDANDAGPGEGGEGGEDAGAPAGEGGEEGAEGTEGDAEGPEGGSEGAEGSGEGGEIQIPERYKGTCLEELFTSGCWDAPKEAASTCDKNPSADELIFTLDGGAKITLNISTELGQGGGTTRFINSGGETCVEFAPKVDPVASTLTLSTSKAGKNYEVMYDYVLEEGADGKKDIKFTDAMIHCPDGTTQEIEVPEGGQNTGPVDIEAEPCHGFSCRVENGETGNPDCFEGQSCLETEKSAANEKLLDRCLEPVQ